jgi:VIT1/CCC1 family predicted Fe2+/Mn2+ transporter
MSKPNLWGRLKASFAASVGDVVFGMEDGTVSIFGLVFGVAATTSDKAAVIIAGGSGAVAAAVSMMAGTYLDAETSSDQARVLGERIAADMKNDVGAVLQRTALQLRSAGLKQDQADIAEQFLSGHSEILRSFATALAAPPDAAAAESPLVRSLWMLIADFLAAAIPIVPFGFLPVAQGRIVSAGMTTLLLIGLGVGRALIGDRAIVPTVIQTVLIGVAAAIAGVGIGVAIAHIFS